MATTLVLTTTAGGESSNSYGTVAELEAYFTGRSDAISFLAANEQTRIAYLIYATLINDLLLFPIGTQTYDNQALLFPRTNLIDKHGISYTSTAIPAKIKQAQFEQALYLYGTGIKPNSILSQGFSEIKLDVIQLKIDKTLIPNRLDSTALLFLSEFGNVEHASSEVSFVDVWRY